MEETRYRVSCFPENKLGSIPQFLWVPADATKTARFLRTLFRSPTHPLSIVSRHSLLTSQPQRHAPRFLPPQLPFRCASGWFRALWLPSRCLIRPRILLGCWRQAGQEIKASKFIGPGDFRRSTSRLARPLPATSGGGLIGAPTPELLCLKRTSCEARP